MTEVRGTYSLPKWRFNRWLAYPGQDVPVDMRKELLRGLHGTVPIFAGGVFNTIAVSSLVAARNAQPIFIIWLLLEVLLCVARLALLIVSNRAVREGRRTPTDLSMLLSVCWSAGVGYGTFISVLSGDWVAATLACLSAAAMVGGICFRNFGAPRLVGVMILLSLGPCAIASALSGEPILLVVALQIPFYLFSMTTAAFRLNRLLLATMLAERENDHRARHDVLTGLRNRAGLEGQVKLWAEQDEHSGLALFYLDLDGFKSVNDRYGHAAGDALLVAVADRLRRAVGAAGIVARIGGDEFIIVTRHRDPHSAQLFADRMILEVAGAPYAVDDHVVTVGASAGIALSADCAADLPDLLQQADAALYQAKSIGKSRSSLAAPSSPELDFGTASTAGSGPRMISAGRRRLAAG